MVTPIDPFRSHIPEAELEIGVDQVAGCWLQDSLGPQRDQGRQCTVGSRGTNLGIRCSELVRSVG